MLRAHAFALAALQAVPSFGAAFVDRTLIHEVSSGMVAVDERGIIGLDQIRDLVVCEHINIRACAGVCADVGLGVAFRTYAVVKGELPFRMCCRKGFALGLQPFAVVVRLVFLRSPYGYRGFDGFLAVSAAAGTAATAAAATLFRR